MLSLEKNKGTVIQTQTQIKQKQRESGEVERITSLNLPFKFWMNVSQYLSQKNSVALINKWSLRWMDQ